MPRKLDPLKETSVGRKLVTRRNALPLVSQADLANPMLRVSDLAEKQVPRCEPDLPLAGAVTRLAGAESGWVAVVRDNKPVGVLSERNVMTALAKSPADFLRLTAEHVMSPRFSQVREDASLDALIETFGARGTLVVDKHGKLVGALYWRNLAGKLSERGLGRVMVALLERERRAR